MCWKSNTAYGRTESDDGKWNAVLISGDPDMARKLDASQSHDSHERSFRPVGVATLGPTTASSCPQTEITPSNS